jgi:Flp pilus assembly protein CpaB
MSSRVRAGAFAAAAALCAGLAAAADSPGGDPSAYGPLREVLVAVRPLPAHRELRLDAAERLLTVRRVPDAFVPPGVLTNAAQAVGRSPAAPIPAGSYVLAAQLASRHRPPRGRGRLRPGESPVEISVEGAGALAERTGERVDVVVTGGGVRPGRTYVAATGVRLLELRAGAGAGEAWTATLALTRPQALTLIRVESLGGSIRLLRR